MGTLFSREAYYWGGVEGILFHGQGVNCVRPSVKDNYRCSDFKGNSSPKMMYSI